MDIPHVESSREEEDEEDFIFTVPTVDLEGILPVESSSGNAMVVLEDETEEGSSSDEDTNDFAKQLQRRRQQVLSGEKPAPPQTTPDFSEVLRKRQQQVLKVSSPQEKDLHTQQVELSKSFDTAEFEADLQAHQPSDRGNSEALFSRGTSEAAVLDMDLMLNTTNSMAGQSVGEKIDQVENEKDVTTFTTAEVPAANYVDGGSTATNYVQNLNSVQMNNNHNDDEFGGFDSAPVTFGSVTQHNITTTNLTGNGTTSFTTPTPFNPSIDQTNTADDDDDFGDFSAAPASTLPSVSASSVNVEKRENGLAISSDVNTPAVRPSFDEPSNGGGTNDYFTNTLPYVNTTSLSNAYNHGEFGGFSAAPATVGTGGTNDSTYDVFNDCNPSPMSMPMTMQASIDQTNTADDDDDDFGDFNAAPASTLPSVSDPTASTVMSSPAPLLSFEEPVNDSGNIDHFASVLPNVNSTNAPNEYNLGEFGGFNAAAPATVGTATNESTHDVFNDCSPSPMSMPLTMQASIDQINTGDDDDDDFGDFNAAPATLASVSAPSVNVEKRENGLAGSSDMNTPAVLPSLLEPSNGGGTNDYFTNTLPNVNTASLSNAYNYGEFGGFNAAPATVGPGTNDSTYDVFNDCSPSPMSMPMTMQASIDQTNTADDDDDDFGDFNAAPASTLPSVSDPTASTVMSSPAPLLSFEEPVNDGGNIDPFASVLSNVDSTKVSNEYNHGEFGGFSAAPATAGTVTNESTYDVFNDCSPPPVSMPLTMQASTDQANTGDGDDDDFGDFNAAPATLASVSDPTASTVMNTPDQLLSFEESGNDGGNIDHFASILPNVNSTKVSDKSVVESDLATSAAMNTSVPLLSFEEPTSDGSTNGDLLGVLPSADTSEAVNDSNGEDFGELSSNPLSNMQHSKEQDTLSQAKADNSNQDDLGVFEAPPIMSLYASQARNTNGVENGDIVGVSSGATVPATASNESTGNNDDIFGDFGAAPPSLLSEPITIENEEHDVAKMNTRASLPTEDKDGDGDVFGDFDTAPPSSFSEPITIKNEETDLAASTVVKTPTSLPTEDEDDDSDVFGDFDAAPTTSFPEPINIANEKSDLAEMNPPTLLPTGDDNDDDVFGDFGAAPTTLSSEPIKIENEESDPVVSAGDDSDFGAFDSAPAASFSKPIKIENEESDPVVSAGDDSDFGAFDSAPAASFSEPVKIENEDSDPVVSAGDDSDFGAFDSAPAASFSEPVMIHNEDSDPVVSIGDDSDFGAFDSAPAASFSEPIKIENEESDPVVSAGDDSDFGAFDSAPAASFSEPVMIHNEDSDPVVSIGDDSDFGAFDSAPAASFSEPVMIHNEDSDPVVSIGDDSDFGAFDSAAATLESISGQSKDQVLGDGLTALTNTPRSFDADGDDEFGDFGAADPNNRVSSGTILTASPVEYDDFGDFGGAHETNPDDDDGFGDFGEMNNALNEEDLSKDVNGSDDDFGDFEGGEATKHQPPSSSHHVIRPSTPIDADQIRSSLRDVLSRFQSKHCFDEVDDSLCSVMSNAASLKSFLRYPSKADDADMGGLGSHALTKGLQTGSPAVEDVHSRRIIKNDGRGPFAEFNFPIGGLPKSRDDIEMQGTTRSVAHPSIVPEIPSSFSGSKPLNIPSPKSRSRPEEQSPRSRAPQFPVLDGKSSEQKVAS